MRAALASSQSQLAADTCVGEPASPQTRSCTVLDANAARLRTPDLCSDHVNVQIRTTRVPNASREL